MMKRPYLTWFVKLLISALLMGWVLRRVNMHDLIQPLSTVNGGLYLLAVGWAFVAYVLNSYKWQQLLIALNIRERCLHLCALNLISLFYSLVLPGQLFGEAIKAYRLAHGRQEKSKLVMSVVIDRLTGLIALLCLGLMGMAFMPGLRRQRMLLIISVGLLLLCLVLMIIMLNVRWQAQCVRFAGRLPLGVVKQRLNSVWLAFVEYRHSPQILLVALILSFAFQSLLVVLNYYVARAMGLTVPFMHFFWIIAIVSIVQMLPFTLAGLGLREGVLVYLLGFEGIAASQSIAYSLAVFSIMVILGLVGGLLELLGYPRAAAVNALSPVGRQNSVNGG